MEPVAASVTFFLVLVLLGLMARSLERRERDIRLTSEALETSQVLSSSLEERLQEIERYRHDLAAVLQELDLELVRAAEEDAQE